jgi:hypothetical protein
LLAGTGGADLLTVALQIHSVEAHFTLPIRDIMRGQRG